MSPGVRMESGHLKNRLPAIRYGRHFPQAGNRVFSRVVPLFPVLVYRRFSGERQPQKIVVSCFARNAGHAIRPANNFLRACVARPACSSTQKILQKDFFDKLKPPPCFKWSTAAVYPLRNRAGAGAGRFMAAAAASGGPSLGFSGGAAAFSFQFMPPGGKWKPPGGVYLL